MAPELTWTDHDGVAFTAPWAAEASGGVALRPGGREARADLHEVGGRGDFVQLVSRFVFGADGGCVVEEVSAGHYVEVGRFPRGGVRWCWAKGPRGQWKVWAEADTGEKMLLNQTFKNRAPRLKLYSYENWQSLDISLLPLQPGPGSAPQVSQPSQAELRARVGQLTSEVQSERAQKAELQQRLAEITQEKAEAAQQQEALRQEKQELQQQLEQLAQEKAEAAQQQEALHQEKQELQQQLEQLSQEKAEATQQQEALHQEKQELQQQLEQLTQEKAEAAQQQQALHQEKKELRQQLEQLTQEKAEATQQQQALHQEKQELQQQLEQLTQEKAEAAQQQQEKKDLQQQVEQLTQEKAEATQQREALHQEKQELRQQLEQSRHDFALLSQQQLEQSRHDLALLREEKAQVTQRQLEQLRHDFMLASTQAATEQKLAEVARQLSQLKEHCDAVVAFIASDSDPQPGAGDSPVSGSWPVIDQEEAQSVQSSDLSSASAGSAKCFLPNTALAGAGSAEGHLLRVEHLKPGDKVRLSDGTEASVLDVKRHPSKRRPYDVMELSTHQGKFPVSDSHHVAVPGVAGPLRRQADSLRQGDLVIVSGDERRLTNVVPKKERTNLFEVFLEPDGPLEMFHLKQSWSLRVFGSAPGCLPEEEGEELLLMGSPS